MVASACVRIFDLDTRIAPFGDRVQDLPLCGLTLEAHREAEVTASGVTPERLSFADHALATAPVLAAFAKAAPAGAPARLALPAHEAFSSLAPLSAIAQDGDRLLYDVFLDAPAGASLESLRASATPALVPLEPATHTRALPRLGPPPHTLSVVADGRFAMHFEHWAHVLWGAPLLVPRALEQTEGKRVRRKRLAPSRVAPGADVHPTAVLEGAVIGPGAEIGAHCVLRHCYVGAGCRLSDFTKAAFSVLGPETHTLADATFEHMVAFGGGTLTNLLLQDSLLGRQVFLTTGVIFWRDRLGEQITVPVDGEERPTGRKVLGGCAGHGSVLGARTIVAPGRALPNRTTVVMRKEEGVHSIAPEVAEGAPACWYDGALVPTTTVDPDYRPEELEA